MTAPTQVVSWRRESPGIWCVTLNRPPANALAVPILEGLHAAIDAAERAGDVKVMIVTSALDGFFAAGADIKHMSSIDARSFMAYGDKMRAVNDRLASSSWISIAAVDGLALGGGLELALRCHGIVAMRNASLQLPEILLGIVPGLGAMVVPYRRWPKAAATFHAMMRRAERVSAKKAHELGIVDRLSDDYAAMIESAVERVHALTGQLQAPTNGAVAIEPPAPGDAIAFNGQKLSVEVTRILERAIVEAAAAQNFDAALEIGYRAFGSSACTAAAREGIDAFLQRRPADFTKTG